MQNIVAFILIVLLCACAVTKGFDNTWESPEVYFNNLVVCESVRCESRFLAERVYFHMIVGTDHSDGAALLVHRLCDAIQLCIPIKRFIIVLHRPGPEAPGSSGFSSMNSILNDLGVAPQPVWEGPFDPNQKMQRSYQALSHITG